MNISSQIIEVLDHLCSKFGIAIDWSQENVLPYLQELAGKYVSWEVATSKMWLWLGVGLVVVAVIIAILNVYFEPCDLFYTIIIALPLLAAGLAMVFTQATDILTCNYFPEKQIIEYVRTLMTNS